ncbi:MAG: hypothetical protein AAGF59_03445 [Pseudomonadota bacterium]
MPGVDTIAVQDSKPGTITRVQLIPDRGRDMENRPRTAYVLM